MSGSVRNGRHRPADGDGTQPPLNAGVARTARWRGWISNRDPEDRERLSEAIADRLDRPMTALGIVFVLLVVAETVIRPGGAVGTAFTIAGWLVWATFVAELIVRMVIAPSTARFLARNWWQLLFLLLPFLRFARVLARLRVRPVIRAGRVVSSTVRGTRIAGRELTGRATWLATVTLIVVLASSQLLYEFGEYPSYAQALHDAAYATVTGEPLSADAPLARLLEVVLAVYSVVVFASLAGMLGAYFVQSRGRGSGVRLEDRPARGAEGATMRPAGVPDGRPED